MPNISEFTRESELISFGSIMVYTGGFVNPTNIQPSDVHIEDIAHALSLICRFNGHIDKFYSVAEHSLLVSKAAGEAYSDEVALVGLLHDATECYISDIPRPIKSLLPGYKELELSVEKVIFRAFGLNHHLMSLVKEFDTAILVDEANALMPKATWQEEIGQGLGLKIEALSPADAEWAFLETFKRLYK